MVPSAAEGGFPTADAEPDTTVASPAAGGGAMAVDFGWGEERKVSGRRRKVEASKKAKPGSFGAHNACRLCSPVILTSAECFCFAAIMWREP